MFGTFDAKFKRQRGRRIERRNEIFVSLRLIEVWKRSKKEWSLCLFWQKRDIKSMFIRSRTRTHPIDNVTDYKTFKKCEAKHLLKPPIVFLAKKRES